jgi:hypothetical protein
MRAAAACMLGLALCTPFMATHSIPPSASSQPSCMCADCGCMHAWFGFVYALYGYTLGSPICIFCAMLRVRQLRLHARSAWLCVRHVRLHIQFLHIFSCRAARVLIVAADRLGLSLGMPCMSTHSAPRFVFFQPRCRCASCGCMHAWLGFPYALYGHTFNPSMCNFLSRAAGAPTVAACTLGLALCTPCMATHPVPPSVFSVSRCMCANCGCMHAWFGFVYALYV